MRNVLKVFKTSLAARTASIILLMVIVVGLVFLVLAVQVTKSGEREDQMNRLTGLLDTVHSTVSIAAFLRDRELAMEVVTGLLKNPTVRAARIYVGSNLLAQAGQASEPIPDGYDVLVRDIESPFSDEIVGRITLVPDQTEIRAEVARATRFTSLMLGVLVILIGVGIVLVVIRLITRPIVHISNRLHALRAETGEKLDLPRGSETDEIGRLVNDVNALIDYLVSLLHVEREMRLAKEITERKFRTIFENAETGIVIVDEQGKLASYNPAFARMLGLSNEESQKHTDQRFAELFGQPGEDEHMNALMRRCRASDVPEAMDFAIIGSTGVPERWVHVVLSRVEGAQLQGVVNDITRRKQSEEAVRELAITDALTGLQNRLGFERQLESMIALCNRHPEREFSLLMLDLDNFKEVNDTYGHEAGDRVLKEVARTLLGHTRKTDVVARLGGDEFVILLDGTTERETVGGLAETIIRAVNVPIDIDRSAPARVGVSIGIARYRSNSTQPSTLIRQADEAMYRAKLEGRNTYRFVIEQE